MTYVPSSWGEWSLRHPLAAAELIAILTPPVQAQTTMSGSEARVQSEVRLEAARAGVKLWRNNRGAGKIDDGRFVRFGLGNESDKLNEMLKSSDLIGWRIVIVTPADVGRRIAQIVCREVKHPGWHLTPGDKEAHAQAAWLALVASDGGDAMFATDVGTL